MLELITLLMLSSHVSSARHQQSCYTTYVTAVSKQTQCNTLVNTASISSCMDFPDSPLYFIPHSLARQAVAYNATSLSASMSWANYSATVLVGLSQTVLDFQSAYLNATQNALTLCNSTAVAKSISVAQSNLQDAQGSYALALESNFIAQIALAYLNPIKATIKGSASISSIAGSMAISAPITLLSPAPLLVNVTQLVVSTQPWSFDSPRHGGKQEIPAYCMGSSSCDQMKCQTYFGCVSPAQKNCFPGLTAVFVAGCPFQADVNSILASGIATSSTCTAIAIDALCKN